MLNNNFMDWFVYILECADNSFYTGITTDLQRRVTEHNESKAGAAYTRARRPVKLVYSESCSSRSESLKREYEIRQMGRSGKEQLVNT